MTATFSIDPARARLHARFAGAVTMADVQAHRHDVAAVPDLPDPLDVLLELDPHVSAPTADQVQLVARELQALAGRTRLAACAVLAPSDLMFGMGRMLAARASAVFSRVEVFRDRAAAEAWLDAGDAGKAAPREADRA